VTETPATTPAGSPVFPPGRYGRRREPRRHGRLVAALILLAVLVAGAALAVRLYQQYGDPAYDPRVIRYTDVTDSGITITFRANAPSDTGAVCLVRARGRDGAVVGHADVPVPAGQPEVTYRLPTTARPVTGEVVRCRPAG
jgi:Domain of unknown function (DUF4307)